MTMRLSSMLPANFWDKIRRYLTPCIYHISLDVSGMAGFKNIEGAGIFQLLLL